MIDFTVVLLSFTAGAIFTFVAVAQAEKWADTTEIGVKNVNKSEG